MKKFVVYSGNNPGVIKEALLKRGNWEEIPENAPDAINQANFIWRPCNFGSLGYFKLDEVSKNKKDFVQVFNHFPENSGMCTKTGLIKTLKQYYLGNEEARAARYSIWDTTPTSFLISAGCQDAEFNCFVSRVKELNKKNFQRECVPAKHCLENMWLVKPANENQGRGIEVFRTLKGMLGFLGLKYINSQWVVQKYIEKPLLYNNRKFDIRVWVLITNKNEVFFYKHGYMRTSSSSYDTKDQNNYVHLTNNCLQKHGNSYGAFEEGNTLSFKVLQDYLRQQYPDLKIDLETHIIARFKDFIIDSFLAWKNDLNPSRRKNLFELFGYDFLIDEDLRVWLIEINTNPYLGVPNSFIADLLPKMVDDMLEITLDPIFPPKKPTRKDGRTNYFELIYCETGSSHSPTPVNLRSSFRKSPYPFKELDPTTQPLKYTFQGEAKLETLNEVSSPHRGLSASIEPKKSMNSKIQNFSLEGILKSFQTMGYFRSMLDTQTLDAQIVFVIEKLNNWEKLTTKDVEIGCKTLIAIANSPAVVVLAEQKNILYMSKLLSNRSITTEIKLATIEVTNILIKDSVTKKKVLCNKIIHDLINIALSSCDEKECQAVPLDLRIAALRCLENFGAMGTRKLYVNGENKEAEKIRNFFISQGAVMALLIISKKAVEPDVKKMAEKCFLVSVDAFDWENQLFVLENFKQFQNELRPNILTDFVMGSPRLLGSTKDSPLEPSAKITTKSESDDGSSLQNDKESLSSDPQAESSTVSTEANPFQNSPIQIGTDRNLVTNSYTIAAARFSMLSEKHALQQTEESSALSKSLTKSNYIFFRTNNPTYTGSGKKGNTGNAIISFPNSLLQVSSVSEMIQMVKSILEKLKPKYSTTIQIKNVQTDSNQSKSPESKSSTLAMNSKKEDKGKQNINVGSQRAASQQPQNSRNQISQPSTNKANELQKTKKQKDLEETKKDEKEQGLLLKISALNGTKETETETITFQVEEISKDDATQSALPLSKKIEPVKKISVISEIEKRIISGNKPSYTKQMKNHFYAA